ncbi:MAG: homocysteine biosynthesis protein [Candidatus Aenigmatarchaeota archaeon]
MAKTYAEINERIEGGDAVVMTAEEAIDYVRRNGAGKAAKEIDVVTTATFGCMCSSGAFLNVGHSKPRIKFGGGHVTLNGVECYAGLAAVDLYVGATARNSEPGVPELSYGGGHVIADIVAGKDVLLKARGVPSSCYPRSELEKWINIEELPHAVLVNPRNAYQNYNVAVNCGKKTIYTYMGKLLPEMGNANYGTCGQLSPLLKDPHCRTIGIGTRIWLAGAQGYVFWSGTQHNPGVPRGKNGIPLGGAGTLGVCGDMKSMDPGYVVGASFTGYGISLALGLGVPVPVLDEDMMKSLAVPDDEILAPVVDYGKDYPQSTGKVLKHVSYAQLRSGTIDVHGKEVPTGSMSSYRKAREISRKLKTEVSKGRFLLQEPVQQLPFGKVRR